jgi:DNA-binding MarR family transcriptional regulator
LNEDKIRIIRKFLRNVEREIAFQIKSDMTCCGVTTSQCHALLEIGEQGPASIKDLAQVMGLDPSSLSRTVDGLVAAGHVSRAENPDDRRYATISLTGQGKKKIDEINFRSDAAFGVILSKFPEEQQETVVETLKTVAETLSEINKGCCSPVQGNKGKGC